MTFLHSPWQSSCTCADIQWILAAYVAKPCPFEFCVEKSFQSRTKIVVPTVHCQLQRRRVVRTIAFFQALVCGTPLFLTNFVAFVLCKLFSPQLFEFCLDPQSFCSCICVVNDFGGWWRRRWAAMLLLGGSHESSGDGSG